MHKKTKAVVIVGLTALAIAAGVWLKIYYVREDSAGWLLWNANEAYLFMSVHPRGYHFTYFEYPIVLLKQYFNAPPFSNDERVSVIVIRVTPSTIERHRVDFGKGDTHAPDFYTTFGDSIYANCQGLLCRWNGTGFEAATEEERRKLDGGNRLSALEFTDVKGWSKRDVEQAASDYQFSIEVGSQFKLSVKSGNVYRSAYDSPTVDLLRPGRGPERIWHLDGYPRRVSKSEYGSVFKGQ